MGKRPIHSLLREQGQAERIAETIRHAILEGHYAPHVPLPSYRELAQSHGVSRATVNVVMDRLETEGLVYKTERRGTFVRPRHRPTTTPGSSRLERISILTAPMQPGDVNVVRPEYLTGYTEAIENDPIRMRFVAYPPEGGHIESIFPTNADLQTEGCILINILDVPLFEWLRERHIPFVVQFSSQYLHTDLPEHHAVYVNKYRGGFEATNYLLGLGHRQIGFIGGIRFHDPLLGPHGGHLAALHCAGLEEAEGDGVHLSDKNPIMIHAMSVDYLTRPSRPTAVLTSDDVFAAGLVHAAQSLGIRVPEDISIVGFNDDPVCAQVDPPLTTVANPRRSLARTAVEMLRSAVAGQYDSPQSKSLDSHLVIRTSTAAPKAL